MKNLTQPSDLLQVLQAPADMFRKTALPLAAELPVDPATAPYLVTTTRSLLWHPEDFNGKVRSALRPEELPALYAEIIREVCTTSVEAKWGSVFPYTLDGVREAISYLQHYGMENLDILAPDEQVDGLLGSMTTFCGAGVVRVSYLPARTVVVVPKDRAYLGITMQAGVSGRRLVLVHNPSRGMAVAGWSKEGVT